MAIATYSEFKARLKQTERILCYKSFAGSGVIHTGTPWTAANLAGATPTTGVALNNATVGAININSAVGGNTNNYILCAASYVNGVNSSQSPIMLVDLLSHSGGLSATTTGEQTTNLPTAALTRYTNGDGVFAGLAIYTAVGTTQTTATMRYTNQAGTANQVSKAILFGGTSYNTAGKLLTFPLADGDTGVRSVEGVTLAASTVSAAGNFGVTLYKPITYLHPSTAGFSGYGAKNFNCLVGGGFFFRPILPGACLLPLNIGNGTLVAGMDLEFMVID